MKLTHDTLMGAILIVASILTYLYTRRHSATRKMLALLGAAGTLIIGILLFFHLA